MSNLPADHLEYEGHGRNHSSGQRTQQILSSFGLLKMKGNGRATGRPSEEMLDLLADAISARVLAEIRVDIQSHEARVSATITGLEKKIGEESEDGLGGTGLAGQVARTNARVDQLFGLKQVGVGITLSLGVTGALLFLGVKHWVLELVQPLLPR